MAHRARYNTRFRKHGWFSSSAGRWTKFRAYDGSLWHITKTSGNRWTVMRKGSEGWQTVDGLVGPTLARTIDLVEATWLLEQPNANEQ